MMRYHEFRAMSTDILLAADGPEESVETGFARAQGWIEACEKRFTRFSDQSELALLNRSAGGWFDASPDLFEIVSQAARLHRLTQGLFDPSVLNALERIGYDRTIDEVRAGGAPAAVALSAPARQRFDEIRFDPEHCRINLPQGLRIDLGGIAKGWIAERAALLLSSWSEACAVNAGGDVFMIGVPSGENAWRVTLEDPADPQRGLTVIDMPPGAVATSSITRRRWQQGGETRHHLIDPRTQLPAVTDWLSVTVIAPHAVEAEVFAKSLLIGGSQEAPRLARQAGGIEFIAVDQQSRLWGSKHIQEFINV